MAAPIGQQGRASIIATHMNTSILARRHRLRLQPRLFRRTWSTSALAHAKKLGATDAGAEASEGCGLSVSVRKGELENVERNRDKSLGITVYVGHRRGNASTSDFSRGRHRADGAGRLRHRPLHRRRPGRPACPTTTTSPQRAARPRPVPSLGHRQRTAPPQLALRMRGRGASRPTSASPTAKARACRRSRAISSAPTRTAFAAAMPVRAIRSRWRRSPARATTCSATPGTARCARPTSWPAPQAVGRYAAERALARLKSRKITTTRMPGAVRVAAGGRPAGRLRAGHQRRRALPQEHLPARFAGQAGVARAHRRRWKTRSCSAARAARRSTKKACATRARKVVDAGRVAGLLPQHLFGAQAGHEDHRQRRRLAQPDADVAPDASPATTSTRCCASWAPACS